MSICVRYEIHLVAKFNKNITIKQYYILPILYTGIYLFIYLNRIKIV